MYSWVKCHDEMPLDKGYTLEKRKTNVNRFCWSMGTNGGRRAKGEGKGGGYGHVLYMKIEQ
jgi:hypothetical protein